MKTLIRKSLVMAVMFTAMVGYANEFVNINNEKGKITNVTFNNVIEGSILTIKDDHGLVLYKETILKQGNYSKQFDLTTLPDGNYLFEMDEEFAIKVIPFNVKLNKVTFEKEKEFIVYKPSVTEKDGIVKIHKTISNNHPFYIKIYYQNGDLVLTQKVENKQTLNKIYDFSTSTKGNYRIVMSHEDRTFVENVKI